MDETGLPTSKHPVVRVSAFDCKAAMRSGVKVWGELDSKQVMQAMNVSSAVCVQTADKLDKLLGSTAFNWSRIAQEAWHAAGGVASGWRAVLEAVALTMSLTSIASAEVAVTAKRRACLKNIVDYCT